MKSCKTVLSIVIWVLLADPGLVVSADNFFIVKDAREAPKIADKTDNAGDEKNSVSNKLYKKPGVVDKRTRYGVGYEFRMKKTRQSNRSPGAGHSYRTHRSGVWEMVEE